MKRIMSKKDLPSYTLMKQVLVNLDLNNKDYIWLISDIEAYPSNNELEKEINEKGYLILSTKELMSILDEEDFQWIWAVFSAIPSKYTKEEILEKGLPYIQPNDPKYNPFEDEPKVQHPFAEFEICAWDSSGMFLVSDNEQLLNKFEKEYPLFENDTDIIFDDWKTRKENAFNLRCKDYIVSFIICIILLVLSFIMIFVEFALILFFVLALIGLIVIWFEWLKIKNNHLIIKKDSIIITDRFNRSSVYNVSLSNLKIEIRHSINVKSGGIIMKFYDNNALVCKYKDMINIASSFGEEKTTWERKIKSLGIEIVDLSEVIKNK